MPAILARPTRRRLRCRLALCLAIAALVALPAAADDTDVFTARLADRNKPNILFVLDFSGSMTWDIQGVPARESGLDARIDILRRAIDDVIDANRSTIRAGVSLYGGDASGIRWPVSDLDGDAHDLDRAIPPGTMTNADVLKQQLRRREAASSTPTNDALLEAASYFRGGLVMNGGLDPAWRSSHEPDSWDRALGRHAGGSAMAASPASYTPRDAHRRIWGSGGSRRWSGVNYISPIDGECRVNAIVLVSDGMPTTFKNSAALPALIGRPADQCEDLSSTIFANSRGNDRGNCGPEIVRTLAENPQRPDVTDSEVITHTIGFGIEGDGSDFLERLARDGQGRFFSARQPEELSDALNGIVESVIDGSQSFTELSIDVDRASFSNNDRAYFSLFEPSLSRTWSGNLKGYFVGADGLIDINDRPALVDKNGDGQADSSAFREGAQSFWSSQPDGNDAISGGASSRLADATRTLYTYTGNTARLGGSGVDLASSPQHRLSAGNRALEGVAPGLPGGDRLRTLLDWLHDAPMGDPLHSKSVTVDYGSRQVVYVMTNQGLLHAIDASEPSRAGAGDTSGGEEIFAYMPKRLLSNLPTLRERPQRTADAGHVYGLDGAITRWHIDADNDGVVDPGDSLWLILGMRRGGEAYHAIDVTNPERPRLRWVIDSDTPGFERLAQTWSRASLVRVKRGGTDEQVLMFGGGYDAATLDDNPGPRASRGNAIYVVARDGRLLQRFDNSDHPAMRHAFAADLTIIDSDADGLADRLYAADLGSQVWRIDFDDITRGGDTRVTRLANLGGNGHQPFFAAPNVALNNSPEGDFLSIALGSGNRTEPLDSTSRNALFMLRDTDITRPSPGSSATFDTIDINDLYDATANRIGSTNAVAARAARDALIAARGWRVNLAAGEKSLTSLVSFDGQLLATTYEPRFLSNTDPCEPNLDSTARFYRVDIATARPDTRDGTNTAMSRGIEIDGIGIPSSPAIIFPKGSNAAQILVDRQRVDIIEQRLARVYWHAK